MSTRWPAGAAIKVADNILDLQSRLLSWLSPVFKPALLTCLLKALSIGGVLTGADLKAGDKGLNRKALLYLILQIFNLFR